MDHPHVLATSRNRPKVTTKKNHCHAFFIQIASMSQSLLFILSLPLFGWYLHGQLLLRMGLFHSFPLIHSGTKAKSGTAELYTTTRRTKRRSWKEKLERRWERGDEEITKESNRNENKDHVVRNMCPPMSWSRARSRSSSLDNALRKNAWERAHSSAEIERHSNRYLGQILRENSTVNDIWGRFCQFCRVI